MSLENLELRCRAHNAYEAERDFPAEARLLRERAEPWCAQVVPEHVANP